MALPMRRAPPPAALDPFDPPAVTPLADDPEYKREVELLGALQRLEERREQEADRLSLEGHFSSKPGGSADGPRDATLRARLAKLRLLPDYFASTNTDPSPVTIPDPALARGVALLQGIKFEPELSRQGRLDLLRVHGEALDGAIRSQHAVVDNLKADRSADICAAAKAHHDSILLSLYRSLQEAAGLTDRERAFRAALITAGYDVYADIISPPFISAPLVLGSERQHDSQISTWRRHLQSKGIVS